MSNEQLVISNYAFPIGSHMHESLVLQSLRNT